MRLRSSSGGVNAQRRFFFCVVQGSEKQQWEFWPPTSQFRFELQKFQRIQLYSETSLNSRENFSCGGHLFSKFGWITGKIRSEKSLRWEWSFLNRVLLEPKVFSEHNFSLVPICFFEIKMKIGKYILFLFFLVQDENQHMTFCLCTVIQLPNKIHYQLLKVFYFVFTLSIIFKIPKINVKIKKKGFALCRFLSSKIFIFLVGWLEFRCLQRNM
jgi:hypothetical protein